MAVKNAIAKEWDLPLRLDDRRYSRPDESAPPAPGNPSATTFDGESIDIDCDASADPASAVTEYRIYVGTATGDYDVSIQVQYAQFPYRVTDLLDDTEYFFKVTAVNAFGLETDLGDCTEVSDTTGSGGGGGGDPGTPIFFDDFDYEVAQGSPGVNIGKAATFAAHGWSGFKDETTEAGRACGYISTVAKNAIPGHESTPCPGSGSRVLRLASLPTTFDQQTDFFLQLGSGAQGALPADVWFQWWMLINRNGSEMSDFESVDFFGGGKLIYALHAGNPPAYPNSTFETAWLINITPVGVNPTNGAPVQPPEAGAISFKNLTGPIDESTGRANWGVLAGNDPHSMYPNLTTHDRWIRPNVWNLIRMRMNISGANGQWQVWRRVYGGQAGGLLPIADFTVGSTANFAYNTSVNDRLGPRAIRMPTTSSRVDFTPPLVWDPDYWMYMADFAMADDPADLPTYGSY